MAQANSKTLNQFRIVFIGAPQAGKTSLMCTWYHFAERVYGAEPLHRDDDDTDRFMNIYHNLREQGVVDPTPPGDATRARFICNHRNHYFELVLCDYSGEDVVRQLGDTLYGPGKPTAKDNVVANDVCNADWIILVHDPIKLVHGSAEDQHDAMWIGKLFPRLMDHGRNDLFSRTTIYLSRDDVAPDNDLEAARKVVHDSIPDTVWSRDDTNLVEGHALIAEEDDRFRLPGEGETKAVQTLFSDVMTTLISRGRTRHKSFPWEAMVGVTLLLVVAAVIGWRFWPDIIGQPLIAGSTQDVTADPEWQQHRQLLADIRENTEGDLKFAAAEQLLAELDEWEQTGMTTFAPQFEAENMDVAVKELRDLLVAVPQPLGLGQIETRVAEIRRKHGPNRDRMFNELLQVATDAVSDAAYTNEARAEWRAIETYAGRIQQGLTLKLSASHLTTNRWWNRPGNAEVQLEVWIVPKGDPRPFDTDTIHVTPASLIAPPGPEQRASLSTRPVSPIQSGTQTFTYRWREGWSRGDPFRINDRLWIRFFEYNFDNETLASTAVPDRGADGLGWFGQPQTITLGRRRRECLIRIVAQPPLIVPRTLQRVFASNGR